MADMEFYYVLVGHERFISLFARSENSGSPPLCDGGIPRWSSVNFQIDSQFLEFCAIGLTDLVLHEGLRALIPYLVVQKALRVSHILDQRSCLAPEFIGQ